jgi:hypothetical protein
MAGRNEGCAAIGCVGVCFLFAVAMCAGSGSGGSSGDDYPLYSPDTAITSVPAEPREWLYIHGPMNVRAEPDPDAEVLRTLRRGDMVQLGRRDANGWARVHRGDLPDGYLYRASGLVRTTAPAAPTPVSGSRADGGRQLHVGSRGGCYYINGNGNKTYVDRSECN